MPKPMPKPTLAIVYFTVEGASSRVHNNDLATACYFGQRLADLLTMRRGE